MTQLVRVLQYSAAWVMDCREYRGRLLTGRHTHWCPQWDDLPMDETCPEWPCACAPELERDQAEAQEDPCQP